MAQVISLPSVLRRRQAVSLLLLAVLTLLPFLGITDFNTVGEPREAVVSQSMLQTGNWVLPLNNGGDIAYKPPLFHWMAALCSLPFGQVTELSARMPSALAAIALAVYCFLFFSRRGKASTAFIASVCLLCTFELHRTAVSCRVDMLLTCCMVAATCELYKWAAERHLRGWPIDAVVLMSGGMLTKGFVGIVLPLMVVAVWMWLRGSGFWAVAWRMALLFASAMVLPAVWYAAAWRQGGDAFLYMVYEENVLRFLGKMPYSSHEHGVFYYVPQLLSGLLPFSIVAVGALCFVPRKAWRRLRLWTRSWWQAFGQRLRQMDDADLLSWLAIAVVVGFYLIPKSKRSVYVLPVYPFVAWFIAQLLEWMQAHRRKWLGAFATMLAVVVSMVFVALMLVQMGVVPMGWLERIGLGEAAMAYQHVPAYAEWTWLAAVVAAVYAFYTLNAFGRPLSQVLYNAVLAFLLADAMVLPPLLNQKSDKACAAVMEPYAAEAPVYSFLDEPTGMLHFYQINFYLEGRVKPFDATAQKGYLLVGEKDAAVFRQRYPDVRLEPCINFHHISHDNRHNRQNLLLYAFSR